MIHTREELLLSIATGENEAVEFKTSFQKEAIESIVAFANTYGGCIIVGVSDNGKIVGITINDETIQNYINIIKQNTEPKLIVDIDLYIIDTKNVLCIAVLEYPVKPVSYKGRYYKRKNNSNHQMSPIEISDTHMKTINSSWDYFTDPYHSLDDIDEQNVKKFIELSKIDDDIQTVYSKFELVKDKKVTFGCYLLFNNNDYSLFTNIEIGRFQTETLIKDSLSIHGGLIEQVEIVMNFIYKHINKAYVITGKPQRDEVWEYPMDAVREIVVNMIVHRDYRSSVHSTVKIFDNKIEFYNQGKLPDELSIEKIKSGNYKSMPRNLQIADVFKKANIIEKYGSGIKRMIDIFNKYGSKEPLIEDDLGGIVVTVYSKDPFDKKDSLPTQEKISEGINEGINEGISLLYQYIKDSPLKRVVQIEKALNIPAKTLERWIGKLKNEKKIEFQGSKKTGGYKVVDIEDIHV